MENETNNEAQDGKPNEDYSPVSDNDSDKIVKKNEEKGNLSDNANTHSPDKPPLVVQIQKEKGWAKQDIIAIVAVLISAILFVITLMTFTQTKRSVDIAGRAMENARLNDSVVRYRDSVKSYLDSIEESKKFTIDSTATQTQINALKLSIKQFEISNMAFVTIGNPRIVLDSNKIVFDIYSIGKFPIELDNGIYGIELKPEQPIEKEKKEILLDANAIYTDIMVNGMNKPTTLDYHKRFGKTKIDSFKRGISVFYFGGLVRFKNLSTFKEYDYYFLEEITALPTIKIALIYQKTYPMDKKRKLPSK
jgi:hypothetical protein